MLASVVAAPPLPDAVPSSKIKTTAAVSWAAIAAGAMVAIAVTLILLVLGSGVGLAFISPGASATISGTTFAIASTIWLIVTQWFSAGMGGYITGRLRARWHGTHTHEVFFRDTAHGLVTWAVSSLVMAICLSSTVFSSMSPLRHASGAVEGPSGVSAADWNRAYHIDRLLRPVDFSKAPAAAVDPRTEIVHILANSGAVGTLSDGDRTYLIDLTSAYTGLGREDAQKRVDALLASTKDAEITARSAADSARKDTAEASLYLALSLLVGAFIASVSAALGGQLRDEHP